MDKGKIICVSADMQTRVPGDAAIVFCPRPCYGTEVFYRTLQVRSDEQLCFQYEYHRAPSMKKSLRKNSVGLARRVHFPEEERRLPWLSLLLDAYAIADTGVAIAIRDEEKRRKVKLACGKGCGNCCVHQQDLPLYPHELVGIYWYVSEKMAVAGRDRLRGRIADPAVGPACLFLIDNACSIHPLRPVGCRQFNVFTTPCAPGEDPYYTRRDDVLTPIAEYTDRAFAAVLPFYNMKREGDLDGYIKLVRSQIMNLRSFDWNRLVVVLEQAGTREP
jgi:Fe-S-cluster containining protein